MVSTLFSLTLSCTYGYWGVQPTAGRSEEETGAKPEPPARRARCLSWVSNSHTFHCATLLTLLYCCVYSGWPSVTGTVAPTGAPPVAVGSGFPSATAAATSPAQAATAPAKTAQPVISEKVPFSVLFIRLFVFSWAGLCSIFSCRLIHACAL